MEENMQKKWDRFWIICAAAVICFLIWAIFARSHTRSIETIQQGIADEIIRFHVIANSDSQEDQELKIKVKDAVLALLEQKLHDASGIEETRQILSSSLDEIKETAQSVTAKEGCGEPVAVTLEPYEFPMKTYGDCTFPAGTYEALRVCIGEAKGKNWWCVVFPNLCFADTVHAVLPEEEKEKLKNVLTEEEYECLFDDKALVKIKWWFWK